jgi:hypothetical protein
MQDLSFDFDDPVWEFNGLRWSIQVFTFENVYGLDPAVCVVTEGEGTFHLECRRLRWAGGQAVAAGGVAMTAMAGERTTTFEIEAHAGTTIRCVKLVLKGLPAGDVVNLRETERRPVPAEGLLLRYPEGWRNLYTPLVVLEQPDGTVFYLRSLDNRVRDKRFALLPKGETLEIELIFEECATEMGSRVRVPAWELGTTDSAAAIAGAQTELVAAAYGLLPWEERPDVPAWARRISLVAAIHCQHWTGHIFNDYDRVLDTIKWLAERIEPERILAYLPGWEGRYYWQYGDYRPDARMGGAEGFARLCREARQLGVRLMPMFGINVVNRGLPNYEQWGAPARVLSAGGNTTGGSVDWDGSRHYDHGFNVLLNPGAPAWQNRLVQQVTALIDTYDFDGVFLDISAVWLNDARYHTYDGVVELIRRIRHGRPNILVAGEGWYDGVGSATPLAQSGHTDGNLHWHDQPYAALFDTFQRSFAHLCLGDPSRGSTGVHELGYNPQWRAPLRKGIIPTVTIVDGTIERAPGKVQEIIEDAKAYAARYTS